MVRQFLTAKLLLGFCFICSAPAYGTEANSSLRSLAESELNSQSFTTESSEPPAVGALSPATVRVAPAPPLETEENSWQLHWGLQSFQPLGRIPVSGLNPINLSGLPQGTLLHLELQSQVLSRLGAFAHLGWAQQNLNLRGPTGAQVERTLLNSFVFLTGVDWELRRWGQRPWILSLRPAVGQISHIASSSWIEANSSQSQWLWSLGPALAWEFYPGFRTQVRSEWRDTFSPDAAVAIQSLNLSWGLQMTLGASR